MRFVYLWGGEIGGSCGKAQSSNHLANLRWVENIQNKNKHHHHQHCHHHLVHFMILMFFLLLSSTIFFYPDCSEDLLPGHTDILFIVIHIGLVVKTEKENLNAQRL